MGLVLQDLEPLGKTELAPYGRTESEIASANVVSYLQNYIAPTTSYVYTYTKAESIALGVQDALVAMFGSVPTTVQKVSESQKNTLVDSSLSYARSYYMMGEEVPDWEW